MKKIRLEIIDGQERIEVSNEGYDLLAVALLESFISDVLKNTNLSEEENK